MLKHQDFFQMKSIMLQDLNNMSVHEQAFLDAKRLRELAEKR